MFTNSPCFKGYMPSKTQEKSAPDRDSFAVGSDFSDPEQQFIKTAPAGSVHLNQWPDEELPEFRKVFYDYCKSLSQLMTIADQSLSQTVLRICKSTDSFLCIGSRIGGRQFRRILPRSVFLCPHSTLLCSSGQTRSRGNSVPTCRLQW